MVMLENLKLLAAHLGKIDNQIDTWKRSNVWRPWPMHCKKHPNCQQSMKLSKIACDQFIKQSNCVQCMKQSNSMDRAMTSPPYDTTALTWPSDRFKHNIVPWREREHLSPFCGTPTNMVRTRSLGALWAPTSSLRPFGPTFPQTNTLYTG